MHIFMTNDDGFESVGLIEMAKKLATIGRVTIIAPNRGRSSCSGSLTLHEYIRLWRKPSYGENITVLSCSGTTADCCKLGLEYWLREDKPDLIVSGINNGFNTGSDCLYSGTVAGALEGVFQEIPSMAISAETIKEPEFLEDCASFASEVVRKYFLEKKYKGILNLNMPKGEKPSWENLKVVKLGLQKYENAIQELRDPSNRLGFWVAGKSIPNDDPTTDVYWVHHGYPTLTSLQWNQTDFANLSFVEEVVREAKGK